MDDPKKGAMRVWLLVVLLGFANAADIPLGRAAFPLADGEKRSPEDRGSVRVRYYLGKEAIGQEEYDTVETPPRIVKQVHLENGVPNGLTYQWNVDHGAGLAWEATFKNGRVDGLWTEYSPHGDVVCRNAFVNGTGTRKRMYDNGILMHQHEYKEGLLDGVYREWHANGKLSYCGTRVRGRVVGEDFAFHDTGKLAIWGTHDSHGRLHGHVIYLRDDGSVMRNLFFQEGDVHYDSNDAGAVAPNGCAPNAIQRIVSSIVLPRW